MCFEISTHTSAEDSDRAPASVKSSLILAVSAWCFARRDTHTDKDVFLFDIDVATIELGLLQCLSTSLGGRGGSYFGRLFVSPAM